MNASKRVAHAATARRLPIGAEPVPGGVHLRVWAPGHAAVTLVTPEGPPLPLAPEGDGHFGGLAQGLGPGSLYGFRLGSEEMVRPDPASRSQPEGPDGWSRVVDPAAFPWTDGGWRGVALPGQVVYEMHVGTFTPAGTWAAAAAELPRLRDLGVTLIDMMPIPEFAGAFAWGYDGAALFAPSHRYGTPDDLRRLIDQAHALGLGVVLDVVYNHLGPEGNHVTFYAPDFVSEENGTDWGAGPDFDGPGAAGVREFVLANVAHWIAEYHFDGLRIDATQDIHDRSEDHILAALARTARAAAGGRSIVLIAENEPQDARLLRRPEEGGFGLDAVWADDMHHAAVVAMTGRRGGYQGDYSGSPQELVSAIRRGWLFQGQSYTWHGRPRGTPGLDLAPERFVSYLENHDQVANTGIGLRLHRRTSPGRLRAMTAAFLLGPATPMLFQGQEWASSARFAFFADVGPALRESTTKGRREQMGVFPNLAAPEMTGRLPDPTDPATFDRCKLRPTGSAEEREAVALHRDLLRLRREDAVIRRQGGSGIEGAVIGPEAFLLRFFGGEDGDRLLLVNLGADLRPASLAEPLLGPPQGGAWRLLWSSEHPDYGGQGTPPIEAEGRWVLPGHSAVLMAGGG